MKFCKIICSVNVILCLVSNREIDEIYYLQSYKEGWTDGKWEEKMDERKCIERNSFVQVNYYQISRMHWLLSTLLFLLHFILACVFVMQICMSSLLLLH